LLRLKATYCNKEEKFLMNYPEQFTRSIQSVILASGLMAGILLTSTPAEAQAYKDIQTSKKPLVLQAQGSFYVGGESVAQTQAELGSFVPAGHISINQMYVRYMIPQKGDNNVAVVMVHGMALTGKSWETTPDGRMGWDEYFVRKGHPVYVPDQVSRGRSGFNQAVFNNVRTGVTAPSALPSIWRFSDENTWPNFRFGGQVNKPFPGNQFPVEAIGEMAKQGVPDLSMLLPTPNPNYQALSELASQVKGAVLISHSQSGSFPLDAALIDPTKVRGMVLVEPGFLPAFTDEQIVKLATIPVMVIFGDNLDVPTGVPGHSWQTAYDNYKTFINRINAVGGKAQMLYLPEKGIKGNSHMIMLDKNNLQVADLVLNWIKEHTRKNK
jgi:pimeloyl-ACP methyl ester carboxylesterase